MKKFKTQQEEFWAGSFGSEYINRNSDYDLLASNIYFFSRAFKQAGKLASCIEFGANIGMNLKAIKLLYPNISLNAIEINHDAATTLRQILDPANIYEGSIYDFPISRQFDLVLIKGVLIHINPDMLDVVYEKLYQASSKYILLCEYYNSSPVAIDYRGHRNRLFKRDFAGEMLDKYSSLELVDYGFVYKRDKSFPQDDITWFLLEKK